MNYFPIHNSFDPLCGNYFGRAEPENFCLNSSAALSKPMTIQQVMLMNDLYGRTNFDGWTNCEKPSDQFFGLIVMIH
jgi:hypothetical protein